MLSRLKRARLALPPTFVALASAVCVLAIVVTIDMAAVRWSHHVTVFAETAGAVVVGLLAAAVLARRLAGDGIARRTILELDLEQPVEESASAVPLDGLGLTARPKQTLREIVEAMDRA